MFDRKIELPWKRTGRGEYPVPGTICLIYFSHTNFSISEYSETKETFDGHEYTSHCFSDAGGFLGDEDLLWLPISELPPIGGFGSVAIPFDYACDRQFMKWDDPRKISRWVELTEDFHWVDKPGLNHREDLPKGTTIGVTGEWDKHPDLIGVYRDKDGDLHQAFVPKAICKDAAGIVYGPYINVFTTSVMTPEGLKKYSQMELPLGLR